VSRVLAAHFSILVIGTAAAQLPVDPTLKCDGTIIGEDEVPVLVDEVPQQALDGVLTAYANRAVADHGHEIAHEMREPHQPELPVAPERPELPVVPDLPEAFTCLLLTASLRGLPQTRARDLTRGKAPGSERR